MSFCACSAVLVISILTWFSKKKNFPAAVINIAINKKALFQKFAKPYLGFLSTGGTSSAHLYKGL